MTIKSIISIIKNISIPHVKPQLGRWNFHNYKETTLKIKYANEDNCGICDNIHEKIIESPKNNKIDDNEYIYFMGYESVHN
jgi:hypothetical protein